MSKNIQENASTFVTEINGVNGVFIRGDNAAFYAMQLRHLIRYVEQSADNIDFYALNTAKNLVDLLNSCVIIHNEDDDTGVGC